MARTASTVSSRMVSASPHTHLKEISPSSTDDPLLEAAHHAAHLPEGERLRIIHRVVAIVRNSARVETRRSGSVAGSARAETGGVSTIT